MKRIFTYLVFSFAVFLACAENTLDSIECSLITCSPGPEVYSLYGHTAIRCRNFTRDLDVVFNYGVFSFRQPHFIWRFMRGKCDYMVCAMPWKYFPEDYRQRGSSITEQILNLTPSEANRLFVNLCENSKEENCEYRYNFLYNNCTTRVRDQIENAIEGVVEYPYEENKKTYRQILHEYTAASPWSQEGNDFLLGASVDTILTERASMFAPEYLMRYMQEACVRMEKGGVRPLIKKTEIIVQKGTLDNHPGFPISPMLMSLLFLLLCLFVMGIEQLSHHMLWIWDVLLLFTQGVVGTLLLFMFLFSEHPSVDSNWLLWIFNPIAFVGIPLVVKSSIKGRRTLWHGANFAILALFLIFFAWIPQDFGNIVVPLTLSLLTRPISYHLFYQQKKKK